MSELKTQAGEKLEVGAVSEELLEKYNRPGPRYTSYPTAPVWQDNFGPDDLEQFYACSRCNGSRHVSGAETASRVAVGATKPSSCSVISSICTFR